MHNSTELMRLHVQASFTHDANERLLRVNEPQGEVAPRVFLGRTPTGNLWRIRADVPPALATQLATLCAGEAVLPHCTQQPHCAAGLHALLQEHGPVTQAWAGPAFYIDTAMLPAILPATREETRSPGATVQRLTVQNMAVLRDFPAWQNAVDLGRQPFLAVVARGAALAVCCSVRITPAAHAAGVETLVGERGKGHAANVVAAWARAVAALGRMALYSTSWQNLASQGVARRLRMTQIGADFHLT